MLAYVITALLSEYIAAFVREANENVNRRKKKTTDEILLHKNIQNEAISPK